MRILWIEDLGGISPDQLVGMLSGWLDDQVIDELVEELEKYIRQPEINFWIDFYREKNEVTNNSIELHFCTQLNSLKKILSSSQVVLDYDIVLIDINLENLENDSFSLKKDWDGIDRKIAGLWVYNKLVYLGFPAERLAFFTGNAVDAAKEFISTCKSYFIEPVPTSFEKNSETKDLKEWLSNISKNDFLLLRRGILDGCSYVSSHLNKNKDIDSLIQFNNFCKKDSQARMDRTTVNDYLLSIVKTIPAKADYKELQITKRLILRAIAHEWETEVVPDEESSITLKAFAYTMKSARNLLSHGDDINDIGYNTIAFLFIVNFRAMFFIENFTRKNFYYEIYLLRLFKFKEINKSILESNLKITWNNIDKKFKSIIGKKKKDGTKINDAHFYNQRVGLLSFSEQVVDKMNYEKELYRIFFHGLYPNMKVYRKIYENEILVPNLEEHFFTLAFS